jgi:hypothetical protein
MQEDSALIVVAEIAAALAGFSGVATALGERGHAHAWTRRERAQFVDLLTHSGIALFASLVPLIFLYRVGEGPKSGVWLDSSLIWAFFASLGVTSGLVRQTRSRASTRFEALIGISVLISFAGLLGLQIANAIWIRAFWPYLGALVGNLAFAFIQFMRLVIPRLGTVESASESDRVE